MSTNYKTNEGVIKAWLNCEAEAGRNASESIFFEGNTIYSYGYHFPLAYRPDADTIEITWEQKWSATTSQHQNFVNYLAHQHFTDTDFSKFILLLGKGHYAGNDKGRHDLSTAPEEKRISDCIHFPRKVSGIVL